MLKYRIYVTYGGSIYDAFRNDVIAEDEYFDSPEDAGKKEELEELHDYISELLDLLNDHNVNIIGFQNRWNFITDIDTNEIRLEGYEEAKKLAEEMEKAYQSLGIE